MLFLSNDVKTPMTSSPTAFLMLLVGVWQPSRYQSLAAPRIATKIRCAYNASSIIQTNLVACHKLLAAFVEQRWINVDVECPEREIFFLVRTAWRISKSHHVRHAFCLNIELFEYTLLSPKLTSNSFSYLMQMLCNVFMKLLASSCRFKYCARV